MKTPCRGNFYRSVISQTALVYAVMFLFAAGAGYSLLVDRCLSAEE